jgi:hypothetical protein
MPNLRAVLNMDAVLAATINPSSLLTFSGFMDYTVVVASQRAAGKSA